MRKISLRFPLILLFTAVLNAAPQLRLSQTVVGPVSVAVGSNATAPSIEITNIGDGTLNPRLTSSAAWLVPSLGQARECSFVRQSCTPVQFALNTATLTRGSYTGTVTISDPAALDAPQTVTVTVQVGGGVPDRVDLYLPPNGTTTEVRFNTSSPLSATASSQTGGDWLAVSQEGAGSFRFSFPYRIIATRRGLSEGSYQGSLVTSGSPVAAENRTVPITLRVTTQPIAEVTPDRLLFRIAPNSARQTQFVSLANRGLGSLEISGVTPAAGAGGTWLTAERVPNQPSVSVSANPANLAPGTYSGSVSVVTNSVQGTISIPVQLEVVAAGAPTTAFQGVVNNATFEAGDVVSQGSIVAVFGEQFTTSEAQSATTLPLPTAFGGVRVLVNDQPAPIYYLSYGQINFQIPYNAAAGDAVVRVERDGQRSNGISVRIASRAPELLQFLGTYAIAVNQDGSFAVPRRAGLNSRPARPGETLVFYAIGLGPTVPAVNTGAAAPVDPLARVPGEMRVNFGVPGPFGAGYVEAVPLFAGLTPNFVGLYQVNVTIPADAPRGDAVPVVLVGESGASNTVSIAIE
ncbi:MAG TPA: hypothetical protein VEQ63_04195 [Bryobacteraceae bacterium]|nr:hypothetical protein [Bryobacteraceae bacterium]